MTVLEEAVARYHRLLDTPAYRDLAWAKSIQEKMAAHNLAPVGRPVCPVLRPHFVSRRQMAAMAKAAESLYSAMDRMGELALSTITISLTSGRQEARSSSSSVVLVWEEWLTMTTATSTVSSASQ